MKKRYLHENWTFCKKGDTKNYPARVPGAVHTDLLAAGHIEDPFFRNNAHSLRDMESDQWEYRTTFFLDEQEVGQQLDLVFEGLDTYADIYLNGAKILSADNMFRQWRVSLDSIASPGDNELRLQFHSPIEINREKVSALPYTLPGENDSGEIVVRPYTRKAAYHFGWDWGPRILTAGIWRPVYLEIWKDIRITDLHIKQRSLSSDRAELTAIIEVDNRGGLVMYEFKIAGQVQRKRIAPGTQSTEIDFEVHDPILWWPNGSGEQHLYQYELELWHAGEKVDQVRKSIGLRTIELIHEKDSIGTSFYFLVNGKPIFMKGANYIPQDVFLPRVGDQRYFDLLQAAVDANMNMVRVWGGGIYESDLFYDLCDSMGLLVWQDFMFANMMPPGDEDFRENVQEEIRQQVRRLRDHACLAIWCGNNEIEMSWTNRDWHRIYHYSQEVSRQMWSDYLKIFDQLIPRLVSEESPVIPYVRTSPLSNWGTPENFNHSSMHYWGVWHGKESFDGYKSNVGRFMVEYGMQSYPDMETIRSFAEAGDLDLESEVMKERQKSYIGNPEIRKHVLEHFGEPADFEDFLLKSQESQALAMEMAITSHMNSDGHCMGTLFWQLNDCWPGPSWSVIDYYGRKKVAYHRVAAAYGMRTGE